MCRPICRAIALALLTAASAICDPAPMGWAVASMWTPVLSTPDFRSVYGDRDGAHLKVDRVGLVRELETVAFPGTVFSVHETLVPDGETVVYRVTTDEYPFPTKTGYFVDARCVTLRADRPPDRPRPLPSRTRIRFRLLSSLGRLYVWGGNCRDGIPQMLSWFPASIGLDDTARKMWTIRGVDCSGLLYEATGGYTPRNASALVRFGRGIPIAGLGPEQIAARARPLDLIVWNKHVVMVLDEGHVIQSKTDDLVPGAPGGVRIEPLVGYLGRLLEERTPIDDYAHPPAGCRSPFVLRRWYPE